MQVLLLHWATDDLFVLPELQDLEKCFDEDYGFETAIFPIPSRNAHLELIKRIALLVEENKEKDALNIIYYGGHAKIDESRQSVWQA